MRDIYKINLDTIEEYQYLINDDEIIDIFSPSKYNTNIAINNNKNEFDISRKISKNHQKYQSNNIDKVTKKIIKPKNLKLSRLKNFLQKR